MLKYRIYIFGSERHYHNFKKATNRANLEVVHINEEGSFFKSKTKKEIVADFEAVYDRNIETKGIIIFGRATVKGGIENISAALNIIKNIHSELKDTQIIGPSLRAAKIFNNKDLTQKILYKNKILTPKTYRMPFNDLEHMQFPVVLKPLNLSGGCGMKFVSNAKDFKKNILELNSLGIKDLIATEFIKGIEVTYTILRLGNIFLRLPVSFKKETDKKLTHPDAKVKLAGFYNGYDRCYNYLEDIMKKYDIYGFFSLQGVMVKKEFPSEYKVYFLEAATRITGSTVIMSAALEGFDTYKTIGNWLVDHTLCFSHGRAYAIQYPSYKHNGKKTLNKLNELNWVKEVKYEDLSEMPYGTEKRDRIRISFSVNKKNLRERLKIIGGILHNKQYEKDVSCAIKYFHSKGLEYEDRECLSGEWENSLSWKFYLSNYLPARRLCSAVFGLLEYNQKIVLTKTKRGWELPGGHIEEKESIEKALKREMFEEAGANINGCILIGYRKIIASHPIKNRNGKSYPFPISYIPHYIVTTDKNLVSPSGNQGEVLGSGIFTLKDLRKSNKEIASIVEIIKKAI
ncbi:MAG: NUDIX domain-containing protein [Candidatus Paceibacterota bacterium]|jgi:hypothetical protein